MQLRSAGFVLSITLAVVGCGPALPATTPVKGKVTHQGQPLEGASVLFMNDAGQSSVGTTDAQGEYVLTTYFGPAAAEGSLDGNYRVTVSKRIPPKKMSQAEYDAAVEEAKKIGESGRALTAKETPPAMVELLDVKYSDPAKTELKAAVSKGGDNTFNFDLK